VRIESGGVSNLFGPGSVADIINYIYKIGDNDQESTVQVEIAKDRNLRTIHHQRPPDVSGLFCSNGYHLFINSNDVQLVVYRRLQGLLYFS
jgi:hypothetical protein